MWLFSLIKLKTDTNRLYQSFEGRAVQHQGIEHFITLLPHVQQD